MSWFKQVPTSMQIAGLKPASDLTQSIGHTFFPLSLLLDDDSFDFWSFP